jgi:nucleoporin NUP82
MMYLAFGSGSEDGEGETERLGVILLAFQDGKVDVCLDVEKVEARWESKRVGTSRNSFVATSDPLPIGAWRRSPNVGGL